MCVILHNFNTCLGRDNDVANGAWVEAAQPPAERDSETWENKEQDGDGVGKGEDKTDHHRVIPNCINARRATLKIDCFP